MAAGSTPNPPTTGLSHGLAIQYKAFARSFFNSAPAVLYLVATCYYDISGFTIFFEEDSGQIKLMEQPPTGIFRHMVTFYVASWTNGVEADSLPSHVTILDAQGEHRVQVHAWR